jgi:hypothetical protein
MVRARSLEVGCPFEVIADGVVIARHTVAGKGVRVTAPEHAGLLRAAARAARAPKRAKGEYEQVKGTVEAQAALAALVAELKRNAPMVETRTLQDLVVS